MAKMLGNIQIIKNSYANPTIKYAKSEKKFSWEDRKIFDQRKKTSTKKKLVKLGR